MSLYRIYIDEVGTHNMEFTSNSNDRFLTLFGVIVECEHMLNTLIPEMNSIKRRFFQKDPDEQIIFHRRELSKKQKAFRVLVDESIEREFNHAILDAYRRWEYTAIAITIDKHAHLKRYGVWHYEPYYYCLKALLERYVLFLSDLGGKGDVMIEGRGKGFDTNLKNDFTVLYEMGSRQLTSEKFQKHLTSRQIKVRKKSANITGLQLADLLAHAAHYDVLQNHGFNTHQKSNFGRQISNILNTSKYRRSKKTNEIHGYGKKMVVS